MVLVLKMMLLFEILIHFEFLLELFGSLVFSLVAFALLLIGVLIPCILLVDIFMELFIEVWLSLVSICCILEGLRLDIRLFLATVAQGGSVQRVARLIKTIEQVKTLIVGRVVSHSSHIVGVFNTEWALLECMLVLITQSCHI